MSDTIFCDSIRIANVVQMLNEGRVVLAHPHWGFGLTSPKVYIWKISNDIVRVVKYYDGPLICYVEVDDGNRYKLFRLDTMLGINQINCGRYSVVEPVPREDVPCLMRQFKANIKDF